MRISRLALVALSAALLGACGRPEGPSIVLITIDTLRSDHLSAYGYPLRTSPRIDELASRGVLFESSYSQTNSTNPSHTTILTGRHVKTHGVSDNTLGFTTKGIPTLAQHLEKAGYATGCVVSSGHLNRGHSGLGRGFDRFMGVRPRTDTPEGAFRDWTRPATTAVELALEWIREQGDHPYFLWLHLFDPHMPYAPEPGYSEHFVDDLAGRVRTMQRIYERETTPDDLFQAEPDLSEMERKLYRAVYRREIPIDALIYNGVGWTDAEVETFRALYDAEIAQTDRAIGELLDGLGEQGAETIVVLTADHGEAFGKGGIYFDHRGIYEPSVNVPLIVAGAGVQAGKRVATPVQAIDLAPTILDLAGLDAAEGLPGQSLAPALRGPAEPPPQPIFIEHANGSAVALVEGDWKLILSLLEPALDPEDRVYRHPGVELYDLGADPGEATNLADREEARVAEMSDALLSWMQTERAAAAEAEMTPEVRGQLKALGYID